MDNTPIGVEKITAQGLSFGARMLSMGRFMQATEALQKSQAQVEELSKVFPKDNSEVKLALDKLKQASKILDGVLRGCLYLKVSAFHIEVGDN